jgi:hypothetical protein
MTMRRYGDLVASVGEFTDSAGKKAKRWVRCGVVMRDTNTGSMSIKLDAVPVMPGWSGWLAVKNIEQEDSATEPDSAGEQVSGIR